jgi:RNA polymerase sigma-70 factor, ECF subfamily
MRDALSATRGGFDNRSTSGDDKQRGNFLIASRVSYCETTVNDDAQLISQALAGQTAAFGQLVQKYQDRLYNTVVHVAGNAEDAKDVVQEAFVQAFLKLESFQGASAFYTWLYRIAFNVAATHRRRRASRHAAEQAAISDGQGANGAAHAGEAASERLESQERCRQVRYAIAQLAEEYRVVLVLREMEGYCYETIAEVLDLPVGTVRSRLHRARMQLREQLKEVLAVEE